MSWACDRRMQAALRFDDIGQGPANAAQALHACVCASCLQMKLCRHVRACPGYNLQVTSVADLYARNEILCADAVCLVV